MRVVAATHAVATDILRGFLDVRVLVEVVIVR
ncbi:hypothetical protein LPPLD21_01790 [Lactiplantibacillus paraplantarum]|uniref:Uncharacterized protein n=1 Tax=Lactiplantibacillus paraplantarum TaxID=60520 RepID=A0ABQ0NAY8_9LACO|nr:hypothetical protein LPPLD21_01790 [Lactiplantibacillus paraplantarum]